MDEKATINSTIGRCRYRSCHPGNSAEEVIEISKQAIYGGIKAIEVTMTVPNALKAIEALAAEYSSSDPYRDNYANIGVGTVLDPDISGDS